MYLRTYGVTPASVTLTGLQQHLLFAVGVGAALVGVAAIGDVELRAVLEQIVRRGTLEHGEVLLRLHLTVMTVMHRRRERVSG